MLPKNIKGVQTVTISGNGVSMEMPAGYRSVAAFVATLEINLDIAKQGAVRARTRAQREWYDARVPPDRGGSRNRPEDRGELIPTTRSGVWIAVPFAGAVSSAPGDWKARRFTNFSPARRSKRDSATKGRSGRGCQSNFGRT